MLADQQSHVAGRTDLSGHTQRSGGSQSIDAVVGEHIGGHGTGVAQSHGDTANDSGVGEVVAHAAKQLLDDDDSHEGADNGHPPGQAGGHVEGQQQAGNNGGEITGGILTADQLAITHLKQDTGGNSNSGQNQSADTVPQSGNDQSGNQSQADTLHDLLGAVCAGDMGRSSNDQLISHYFLPPFFIMILARAMEGARGRLAGHTKEQVPQLMHRSALSSCSSSTLPFS